MLNWRSHNSFFLLLFYNIDMLLTEPKISQKMPVTPIFNPTGDDSTENRSIWFGNTTNLMQLNDVRYTWAVGLYQQMRENFWIK